MVSVIKAFCVLPYIVLNSEYKSRFRVRAESLGSGDSVVLSTDSVRVNGVSSVGGKERIGSLVDLRNGKLSSSAGVNEKGEDVVLEKLEVLWDDGYGSKTVKDYLDNAKDMIKPDGGPPRWFCPVECGRPLKDSPVLLFLPGNPSLDTGCKIGSFSLTYANNMFVYKLLGFKNSCHAVLGFLFCLFVEKQCKLEMFDFVGF